MMQPQSKTGNSLHHYAAGFQQRSVVVVLCLICCFARLCAGCDTQSVSSCSSAPKTADESRTPSRNSRTVSTNDALAAALPSIDASTALELRQRWGIKITGLRLSAGGYMIDFRYKVLDTVKAAALAAAENKPYLIDQASGAVLLVPKTPKLGPLRQSVDQLTPGRIYFMLFSNPGCFVKPGNKITVVIGNFRVENLTVQ